MGTVTGFMVAFSLPFILPLPDEPEALTTDLWRVIFMVPALIGMAMIVLFVFVFKYDTPLFYKKKGDVENYNQVISLIYITHENDENNEVKDSKADEDIPDEEDLDREASEVLEVRPSNERLSINDEEISSNAIAINNENKEISTSDQPDVIEDNQSVKVAENEEADKDGEAADVPVKMKPWPAHYKKHWLYVEFLVVCFKLQALILLYSSRVNYFLMVGQIYYNF
jgi:ABC-type Na+ efflux pump permease subunit